MHRPDVTFESFQRDGIFGTIVDASQYDRLRWIRSEVGWYLGDPKGTLLDLACGVGDVACAVRQRKDFETGHYYILGEEYTWMVDSSQEELNVAQRRLPKANYGLEDITVWARNAVENVEPWKVCTCCEVIEHMIPFEAFQLIYNLVEVCRWLVITTPNGHGPRWDNAAGSGHTMLWTKNLLRRVLEPDLQAYTWMSSVMGRELPKLRYKFEYLGNKVFLGAVITKEHEVDS